MPPAGFKPAIPASDRPQTLPSTTRPRGSAPAYFTDSLPTGIIKCRMLKSTKRENNVESLFKNEVLNLPAEAWRILKKLSNEYQTFKI
jgi:hypothetical protein